MTSQTIDRTFILLSLQRAMLGEVFPSLRRISVDWTKSSAKFWAYVDGPLAEEDAESISCISAEFAADFLPEVEVDHEVVRIDSPQRIEDSKTSVYQRRE